MFGLGALVKYSAFYFFFPLILFELIFYKMRRKVKWRDINLKPYLISLIFFFLLTSYFVFRSISMTSEVEWPVREGLGLGEMAMKFLRDDVGRILFPHVANGFLITVVLLGIYSFGRLLTNLFKRKLTDSDFLKFFAFGWMLYILLAAVLFLNGGKIGSIARDSISAYPLLIAFGVKDLGNFLRGKKSIGIRNLTVVFLVGITLLTPVMEASLRKDFRNTITKRYGEITYRPFASDSEKLSDLRGDAYMVCEFVNLRSENVSGAVFGSPPLRFYLNPFIYTWTSERFNASDALDWYLKQNIRWIIYSPHGNIPPLEFIENQDFVTLVYDPEYRGSWLQDYEINVFGLFTISIERQAEMEYKVYEVDLEGLHASKL
jgi:hypothetical protein